MSNYRIAQAVNGGGWEYYHDFPTGAAIANLEVWVITTDEAEQVLQDAADEIMGYPSVVHFNGNDARGLEWTSDGGTTWELLDIIGDPNEDPGDGWEVAGVATATKEHTLVRKSEVTGPTTDWVLSAGTNTADSQWEVYDQNTFEYIGFHEMGGSYVDNVIQSNKTQLTNYPNPFNPSTTIYFSNTASVKNAEIAIYNIKGQKIKTFDVTRYGNEGSVLWEGKDVNGKEVPSGIYFSIYDVEGDDGDFTSVKKLILLK
ncbi:MAG: T9SS type A sorting domain-containing protein [Candidatus Cloacimonetes bacterium]|nr:T9SS type A sorting domain-containing protein [Candidatus Cloacimonadota bacterium]